MGALINRRRFIAFFYLDRCYSVVVLLFIFSSILLSIFVCFKANGHSESIPPLYDGFLVLETTDDYSEAKDHLELYVGLEEDEGVTIEARLYDTGI